MWVVWITVFLLSILSTLRKAVHGRDQDDIAIDLVASSTAWTPGTVKTGRHTVRKVDFRQGTLRYLQRVEDK